MPTLDWIGKKAVVNHHRHVPFHLLKSRDDLSCGDPNSGNLLVQADNLLALKALLPYYAGQVKCIYIDPPYNTGNEGWIYNDNVNSPEMKAWLGKVVGREAEDLSRHDKWLCMMYPRLQLLREFLREDGFIFIQIGHEESGHLRLLLDEIFQNFRNTIIVRRGIKNVQAQFETVDSLASAHDIIYCYSKSRNVRFPRLQHQLQTEAAGKWDTFWRGTDRPTMRYELFGKTPESGQWRWKEERAKGAVNAYKTYLADFAAKFSLDEYYAMILMEQGVDLDFVRKDDRGSVQYYVPPRSYKLMGDVWMDLSTSGTLTDFPHEKHLDLLSRIIGWVTGPNDIILDSFGGSGSTGHAVLKLNKEINGNRNFILVEMDQSIAENITLKRLQKVSAELNCGFSYCELGSPLFDEKGRIKLEVTFKDLARHVFFTETGKPLSEQAEKNFPLLGVADGVAVYLLYNGVLKDKSPNGGNVLTIPVFQTLPQHDGPKVIYGVGCRIGAVRLTQENITFRQIPYAIKVS